MSLAGACAWFLLGACFSVELFGIGGHGWPELFLLPLARRSLWSMWWPRVVGAWKRRQKRLDEHWNNKASHMVMEYEWELHLQQSLNSMSPDQRRQWHLERLCAKNGVDPCSDSQVAALLPQMDQWRHIPRHHTLQGPPQQATCPWLIIYKPHSTLIPPTHWPVNHWLALGRNAFCSIQIGYL